MNYTEARKKYFDICVELENKLIDIKKKSIYLEFISLNRNDRQFEFERKLMNYYESNWFNIENNRKNKINDSLKELRRIGFYYFLDGYLQYAFDNAIDEIKEDFKWTNRNSIRQVINGKISVFNGKEIVHEEILEYLKEMCEIKVFKNVDISNLQNAIYINDEDLEKITKKSFERYMRFRNNLAHKIGNFEITNKDEEFIKNEFNLIEKIIKMSHERLFEHEDGSVPRAYPLYKKL